MNEDQKNWNEMAKTMMKIDTKPEEMFNTIHIKDQVRSFKTILKYTNMTWYNTSVLLILVYFKCSRMVKWVGPLL